MANHTPPGRLTPDAKKAVRWSVPQLKHWQSATGRHPSKELSGSRPSRLAEAEEEIRALARHSKADAAPLLVHLEVAVEEEILQASHEQPAIPDLVIEETEAEGLANLAQLALMDGATPEEIEDAHDKLFLHAVKVRRLLARLRLARRLA